MKAIKESGKKEVPVVEVSGQSNEYHCAYPVLPFATVYFIKS